MTIEIRRIDPDETVGWLESMATSFLEPGDHEKVAAEVRKLWDYERVWAAIEDGTIVGTLRTWATELTLPGCAQVPAAAVSGVTVRPTHRRRGLLSRMIAAEHAAQRERGELVSMLYASEYPIYGRFGYGPAVTEAVWTVDTSRTGFVAAPSGSVQVVRIDAAARDQAMSVFEACRRRQPGEIRRRDFTWDYALGIRESLWGSTWKGFLAVHRDPAGELDGYARYRAEEKWVDGQPRSILHLEELHALTNDAYDALWRFLIEIDFVGTVKAERRRVDERLPWILTNARAAVGSEMGDGLWVKPLEPAAVLAARSYESEGSVTLEIVGVGAAPDGRQRLALDAGPDGATCRPTDASPDLTISVGALGSALLGGVRLRDAVLASGADEHRPGALGEADRLLATRDQPWCSTFF